MNLSMIGSYLKAKWSKGLGNKRADVSTKDIRLLSCFGDGKDIPVCPALMPSKEQAGKFYCNECGCGDRRATWLNTDEREYGKLDHPYLSCPRKMPGFSDYEVWVEGGDARKREIELTLNLKSIDPEKVKPVHPDLQEKAPKQDSEEKPKKCDPCEKKAEFQRKNVDVINYYRSQGENIPEHVQQELNRLKAEAFGMDNPVEASPAETKPKCAACEKRRKELIEARNEQKGQS